MTIATWPNDYIKPQVISEMSMSNGVYSMHTVSSVNNENSTFDLPGVYCALGHGSRWVREITRTIEKNVKDKVVNGSLWETHLTATGCHLPYGITVLPATRHKWMCPALTPASKLVLNLPNPDGWKECTGRELITSIQTQRPNHYATKPPSFLPSCTSSH